MFQPELVLRDWTDFEEIWWVGGYMEQTPLWSDIDDSILYWHKITHTNQSHFSGWDVKTACKVGPGVLILGIGGDRCSLNACCSFMHGMSCGTKKYMNK